MGGGSAGRWRPPWWHRALVPALSARASGDRELASLVFGVDGGQAVPPDKHRHLLHELMFAFRHLETDMQFAGLLPSEEKHCGFLNKIL